MLDAYKNALRNYANFSGRASRYEYWMYTLIYAGLMIAAMIIETVLGIGSKDFHPLMWIVLIGHFVPNLAIAARRLHDQDRSGWWLLLLLTGVGGLVILVLMLLPGSPGSNRYSSRLSTGDDYDGNTTGRSTGNVAEEIERLAQLQASGSISQDEYASLKARLLAGSR